MGTLGYLSSMTSYMKVFIERVGSVMGNGNPFEDKNLYLVVDGSEPSDTVPHVKHVWKHVDDRFGMNFLKIVFSFS